MSGAGLHKAGLSELGGLGLRKLAGCRSPPSAGDQLDSWRFILSALLGVLHTGPFLRFAQRAHQGLCLEGLGQEEYSRPPCSQLALGLSYDLEPGPATGSQALPVWLEGGGWILACPL